MVFKRLFLAFTVTFLLTSSAMAAQQGIVHETTNITPQNLNQNPQNFIGKRVVLTGKIDRVLGNGSYIVSDSQYSSNRVLIFTSSNSNSTANEDGTRRQQAGTKAVNLNEGDSVRLVGRVEQFNVSSEVDSFSPKTDTETIKQTSDSTPVLVIHPGDIQRFKMN